MKIPTICRYCGGVIRLAPARKIYGASTDRLGLAGENIYLCQNCNARVGCHKGTNRPLGNVAIVMRVQSVVKALDIFIQQECCLAILDLCPSEQDKIEQTRLWGKTPIAKINHWHPIDFRQAGRASLFPLPADLGRQFDSGCDICKNVFH